MNRTGGAYGIRTRILYREELTERAVCDNSVTNESRPRGGSQSERRRDSDLLLAGGGHRKLRRELLRERHAQTRSGRNDA